MHSILRELTAAGYEAYLVSFSALDRYFRISSPDFLFIRTNADLTQLARLFESLRYPGLAVADAALDGAATAPDRETIYFQCADNPLPAFSSFGILSLRWNIQTNSYRDEKNIYPQLRWLLDKQRKDEEAFKEDTAKNESSPWWGNLDEGIDRYSALMDAAIILSRYGYGAPSSALIRELLRLTPRYAPPTEAQRLLLILLLTAPRPDYGLTLLKKTGFIQELWPELEALDNVNHSKDFHPEGNAWAHTMETFQYRKKNDLLLSLGLLLHDIGKPKAESTGNHPFDKHAELGEWVAVRFLERLNFPTNLIGEIRFLVRNHMLPAALPRLPLVKTRDIMEAPLFPTLMELYRCDESSSFKGLNGYYDSSASYQNFLRHRRNPYRSADGKKLAK